VPLVLAVLVAGLVAAAISLALGIPSLRLRGVYLAIVTLAFGMFCQSFLFAFESLSGGAAAHIVERPALLQSDRVLYLVLLVPLALCLAVIRRLRDGNVGRVLFAIRDSEDAAQAMGVRLAPYKIGVFAFSAGITGVAGAFYAVLVGATPAGNQFGVLQSWFFLAMPVIGGLSSLVGALVGAATLAFATPLVDLLGLRIFLASGILTIAVLLLRTEGVVGAVLGLRRSFQRAAGLEPPVAASFLPERGATEDRPRLRVTAGAGVAGPIALRVRRRA
jgi:branched-chain amino acid transport system permease protein